MTSRKTFVERFSVVEEFELKKEVKLRMLGVEGLWAQVRKEVEGVLREEKESEGELGDPEAEEVKKNNESDEVPKDDDMGGSETKPERENSGNSDPEPETTTTTTTTQVPGSPSTAPKD